MNSAAIPMLLTNQKYGSDHDRCRRGSLPLKKRRFSMEEDTTICTTDGTNASSHDSLAVSSEQTMMMSTAGDDEKIAALALVAAAASTYAPVAPVANVTTPCVDSSETCLKIEEAPKDALGNDFAFDQSPSSSKRIHRPPLANPLPEGCHGRTSRNNSYCRRHPCYNGSKYCKLHYQHYIVAGLRTPMDEEEVEDTIPLAIGKIQSSRSSPQTTAHQDKRYTGSADGTRCLATTTRGRVCAYVSANGTKYCYLHADYGTNPPPKRGGGGQKVKVSGHGGELPFRLGSDHLSNFESLPIIPSAAEVSVASPASVASEDSRLESPVTASAHGKRSSEKTPAKKTLVERSPHKGSRKTASKLAEKHADSPFPLLSMISTDQWFHKIVVISTGPLADQVGQVEKWGNGWVSVSVPGVGLHNRRSFELYLHAEEQCEGASASSDSEAKIQESNPSLLRCISREAASPPPSSNGSKTASLTTSYPTKVPETPRPDRESLKMQESTPVPKSVGNQARGGPQVPHVTPSSPRKTHRTDDIPLIETLQLAAEGSVTKYNLDMLFGTAALERGRRTLKTVSRYEDTAMLGKKRGRKVSLEAKTETSAKKKRSVA